MWISKKTPSGTISATEAAAAKLQTRKAHSHAALIGGSSMLIPGLMNLEVVNNAICPTIPKCVPVVWVGSMVSTINKWVYDCFEDDDLLFLWGPIYLDRRGIWKTSSRDWSLPGMDFSNSWEIFETEMDSRWFQLMFDDFEDWLSFECFDDMKILDPC